MHFAYSGTRWLAAAPDNDGFSLYILRCADGSLYTGIARDVARRVEEHRDSPRGAKYLRGRAPFRLVFERPVGDRAAASRIENHVKRLPKSDKEALVAGDLRLDQVSGDSA